MLGFSQPCLIDSQPTMKGPPGYALLLSDIMPSGLVGTDQYTGLSVHVCAVTLKVLYL